MVEGSLWASFAVDRRVTAGALIPGVGGILAPLKVLRLIFGILTIVPFFWGMLALRAGTMPITTTAARCGCCTS